jgi:hypothetical protein
MSFLTKTEKRLTLMLILFEIALFVVSIGSLTSQLLN